MSSFTGVYHFDGKPVDPEMVASMGPTIARKGPDGGNDYCDGPLGMSYRAFHTTRESHWEVQPMVGPSGEVLCWDGRLDNREELQTQLCVPRVPSDAELVMAAYRKWGEEFLAHLIGDFALAIFDPKERQILLGRDFFGPRPLFYLLQAEKLMWSTDLLPLMQHGGVDLALDDDYIAQFLVLSIEPHRTPYRNVRSVEPGHVVAFRDGKLRKNTWYWKPDPAKDIRYKTDREYEENFYALFRQSVKARLRSDGPVWADLSGGLDSSSIVCMADEIMTQETVDCPRLDTYTAINGKSILTNELPYVTLVEQLRGRSGFHLREDDLWFNDILRDQGRLAAPNTMQCIPKRIAAIKAGMDRDGARVKLTGHGGDHLLGNAGASAEPADLMRGVHWREMHCHLKIWSASIRQPYFKTLLQEAILPLAPARVRAIWETDRCIRQGLPEDFRGRFARETFQSRPPDTLGSRSPSVRERSRLLVAAIRFAANGVYPESAAFELRFPYLDRPLVEWLFAIPTRQVQRPGETRSLMRRAFRGLLPAAIWDRQSKGTIDEAICRGLGRARNEIQELLSASRLVRRGYFSSEYLNGAVESVVHGGRFPRGILMRLLALEVWLANFDASPPAHQSRRKNQVPLMQGCPQFKPKGGEKDDLHKAEHVRVG